jgi:signal transduction histidine kinase
MPQVMFQAVALVIGSSLYFYLMTVLLTQNRRGWPARLLIGLVACSGLWYMGNLFAVYLALGTGREQGLAHTAAVVFAHIGGWGAWPVGIALAWQAFRRKETEFLIALCGCGAVSGIASGVFPLGSFPTVVATLPTPITIIWYLERRQIFGLYLPRRAVVAAVFGMAAAVYMMLVAPAAELLRDWLDAREDVTSVALLFAGAVVFIPLYNYLLEREVRLITRKRERIRSMMRDAARLFDSGERIRFFEEGTREEFGFRAVRIVLGARFERGDFTHVWNLESEGRQVGWLLVDARPRRRLDVDEPALEALAQEIGYSLGTLRLVEEKIGLEKELLAQEHLASLGKVSAAIAHEIKNPLSAIKTIVQLMEEDAGVTARYGRDLGYIQSEVHRLATSVNQLLRFAKPVEEVRVDVDLSGLVTGTAQALGKQAEAAGVCLAASVEPGWRLADGDPALVSQILLNLVLNAIEAAPAGSTVGVLLCSDESRAELVVEDAGPGIPLELRDRVFEPFFTTRHKGTGLGLAIVRKAVNHLGGSIELESPTADGRGTRFRVGLPAAERVQIGVNAAAS